MNVPLVDLEPDFEEVREEVRSAMDRVCRSQRFILGPEVEAFEEEIASFCGVEHAIGVSSGTDALVSTLMALEVGPGDEVVTTPFTFFATAGAVARVGATPVFADIDEDTWTLDPQEALATVTERTKALVPVHLFGRCSVTGPLNEVASSRDLVVVEDAAQAIGARDGHERIAGSIGAAGCFSFFPSKNLGAFGDAGMVTTDDPELASRLQRIRVHGAEPKYHHGMIGGNFRLDELQAAILRVKLTRLEAWTRARRDAASLYRSLIAEHGLGDRVDPLPDCQGHVYHQFVVRTSDRDGLRGHLAEAGVATAVYYPVPLHLQECFGHLGYRAGDLPRAEAAARETLALPMYPGLSPAAQAHVVESIASFWG